MSNNQITVLNVAEKPSVARALAGVFAEMPQSRPNPNIRSNHNIQIFSCSNVTFPFVHSQGNGTFISSTSLNRPHTMITTSVRGHLATQDFPPDYGWNSVPPVALFDAPIETKYNQDMIPLKQMLEQQARNVQAVILWLDCDREGEAICDEVRNVCLQGNPRLQPYIYRAKFSTVLPQEIVRALKSLGKINEFHVQAVQARSEHDLRVGAAFTRFQTLRLQKNFDEFANGNHGVVSYGPCQFPTLGFVVERWARIETFRPEDFWYIDMSITVNADGSLCHSTTTNTTITTTTTGSGQIQPQQPSSINNTRPIHLKWKRDRLYDRVLTMAFYDACLEAGEATVISLSGRPKNKWRPVPLATVELQKRASKYLRIGSETLMHAAEELYQSGYISYPRTETEKFRPEFDHISLIRSFQAVEGTFQDYASKLLSNHNFQNPRAGTHDDQAHPPITPCKAVDPATIPDRNQREIYTLIVKHYLACCSRDAIGKETTLTVRMGTEEFTAKGLMILERNWLEIYAPWERWSTGQGELPNVQIGSRIQPTTLLMKDGRTVPPNPISEVELITLMDRNGIGTDATIATHITTIQDRGFVTKDAQQRFEPNKLGIALVEGYNSMGYQLNRPDLRREMESECNALANGRKRKEEVMQPILTKMLECFNRANAEADKLDAAVAKHFTRIGTNDANAIVVRRNFTVCGSCQGMTTWKELRSNNPSRARGGNAQSQHFATKLIHCQTCSLGLRLPRGIPEPQSTSVDGSNTPVKCPICNYQTLKITQGDGYNGNGYTICPKCFSDPPTDFGGDASGDFRCFQCTHPTCSQAGGTRGGDVEIYQCPFCLANGHGGGKITLKKLPKGGFVLSCSNYSGRIKCSYSMWLPRESKDVQVLGNNDENASYHCSRCSTGGKFVKKLKFVWKSGSLPPDFGRDLIACVLCNETLKMDLGLKLPLQNQVQIGSRRPDSISRNGNHRPRNGGLLTANVNHLQSNSSNTNTITCYRCNQPGHFASSCPQR
jgi:DNA topoisomerase III